MRKAFLFAGAAAAITVIGALSALALMGYALQQEDRRGELHVRDHYDI